MTGEFPTYFEWDCGDDTYTVEYDPVTGVVLVEKDSLESGESHLTPGAHHTIGVFRFENGCLVECLGRGVLPDALADEIETRYAEGGK